MMYLEHAGELDSYAEIQSHKDSVDIHVLLSRYQNGDVHALQRVQGVFGDFTQLPKTYADALNLVNDGKQLFDGLPVDVRAKFGHDFARFVASIGTPEFMAVFGENHVSSESGSVEVNKEVSDSES
ncbi:VP3 [Gokushovirus WZ-2015a]|nr:VP3 [Gokushovirus WZ-2015a]